MTVNYGGEKIHRLFFKWRGSVWKMTYKELIIFLVCFYTVNFTYRFGMTADQKIIFEKYVVHCDLFRRTYLPVSFLLGFYVSVMVNRWWNQFELLPWPDRVLSAICFNINESDSRSKLIRSTLARYLNLSIVLAFRDLSTRVRKRFPTFAHLRKADLITEDEIEELEKYEYQFSQYDEIRWVIPIEWSQRILEQMLRENIVAGPLAASLMHELTDFRTSFKKMYQYVYANLPLVYTHVAAIAVYTNFCLAIIGQQFLEISASDANRTTFSPFHNLDYYFPLITLIEMMFYIGWFKVGCELMLPYGEADNDFDLNFIIDRHWSASSFFSNKIRDFIPNITPDDNDDNSDTHQLSMRLPHTALSAQVQYHSVKLPAKHYFEDNIGKYDIDSAPLFEFEPFKIKKEKQQRRRNKSQKQNSPLRKTNSAEEIRTIEKKHLTFAESEKIAESNYNTISKFSYVPKLFRSSSITTENNKHLSPSDSIRYFAPLPKIKKVGMKIWPHSTKAPKNITCNPVIEVATSSPVEPKLETFELNNNMPSGSRFVVEKVRDTSNGLYTINEVKGIV